MLEAARSRPNHYQVLGISPGASNAQINDAFAKKISLFGANPARAAAQVCVAYETLRNPIKRRDYDLSLGLAPPLHSHPNQLKIALKPQRWAPFIGSVAADAAQAVEHQDEPHVTTASLAQRAEGASPRSRSTAAAELERLGVPLPAAKLDHRQEASDSRKRLPPVRREHMIRRPAEHNLAHAEGTTVAWSRTGLAIGAVVLGVVVLGAWAGTVAGNDVQESQAQQTAVPRERAQPLLKAKPSPAVGSEAALEPASDSSRSPHLVLRRPRGRAAQRAQAWVPQVVGHSAEAETSDPTVGQSSLDEQLSTKATAPAENASMPLSNKVIARTIDRIGYRCGAVSSASAIAGRAGVFQVSCTSGEIYQATPVRGRYRFRRVVG